MADNKRGLRQKRGHGQQIQVTDNPWRGLTEIRNHRQAVIVCRSTHEQRDRTGRTEPFDSTSKQSRRTALVRASAAWVQHHHRLTFRNLSFMDPGFGLLYRGGRQAQRPLVTVTRACLDGPAIPVRLVEHPAIDG